MNCKEYMSSDRVIYILSAIMVWGCLTFGYIKNGFSYGLGAFLVALCIIIYRSRSMLRIQVSPYIVKAFLCLYGTLFVVGILQNNIQDLISGRYSALDLFLITAPLWMVLIIGRIYDLRKLISIIILANMWAFSVYGIWKYIAHKEDRFTSFYGYPTDVGIILDLLIPCTIAIGVYYWKRKLYRWLVIPLVPLEIVSSFLTETRGSYLALVVALIVTGTAWCFYQNNKNSTKLKWIMGACVGIFTCFAISYSVFIGAESKARMVGGERLLMWESSYHMWEDHKMIGIGLSQWKEQYNNPKSPYRPAQGKEKSNNMPHNIFIQFLSTGGLISLCGFMGYLFFMMRYFLKTIKRYTANPFSWMMLFMFSAFIAHGFVDGTIISRQFGRIFYLLLGVGILFTEGSVIKTTGVKQYRES